MQWKHSDSPVKKKFRPVKSVMLTVLWDTKRSINHDFLEKGSTANSDLFCQLLRQNSPDLLNDPRTVIEKEVENWYAIFNKRSFCVYHFENPANTSPVYYAETLTISLYCLMENLLVDLHS